MAATRDIVASYRNPAAVVRRLLGQGPREDRNLVYLMVACLIFFVAQTPRLAREAHVNGTELVMLLGAPLLAWLFIAPLNFYIVRAASTSRGCMASPRCSRKVFGGFANLPA